jgi:hypothetical protein
VIPEEAWTLIPEDIPSDLPDWVPRLAGAAELTARETRAYAWAMYLLSRLTDQALVTAVMGLASARRIGPPEVADITAGFIPFDAESPTAHRTSRLQLDAPTITSGRMSYGFGIVVGLGLTPGAKEEASSEDSPSQVVSIAGFPIVVEYREINYSAPPTPLGAMAACYAKPRASKRFYGPGWSAGIVIARHSLSNLGFATGISVPMASGGSLPVADIDWSTTIDAAILDVLALPSTASPLRLATAIGPSSSIDVRASSGTFSAQVLRVNDHPSYYGNMVAHRLFLDTIGATGDSGSLVARSSFLDSAGIYMGSTGGAVPEGIVQSMRQVVNYFDIDLFD